MTLGIIVGACMIIAAAITRLQWEYLKRSGRFKLDADGEPMGYRRLVTISWLLMGLGVIFLLQSIFIHH